MPSEDDEERATSAFGPRARAELSGRADRKQRRQANAVVRHDRSTGLAHRVLNGKLKPDLERAFAEDDEDEDEEAAEKKRAKREKAMASSQLGPMAGRRTHVGSSRVTVRCLDDCNANIADAARLPRPGRGVGPQGRASAFCSASFVGPDTAELTSQSPTLASTRPPSSIDRCRRASSVRACTTRLRCRRRRVGSSSRGRCAWTSRRSGVRRSTRRPRAIARPHRPSTRLCARRRTARRARVGRLGIRLRAPSTHLLQRRARPARSSSASRCRRSRTTAASVRRRRASPLGPRRR